MASRTGVVVQRGGIDLVVADSYRTVVKLVDVSSAAPGTRRSDHHCGNVGIGARRAQALVIVTRRDETACGLGRRRR